MSGTSVDDAASSLVASWENNISRTSVKAVGIQIALMSGISLATVLAFSFFRPREKKVYAPKVKYQLPAPADPHDDPDYEPPPPTISNSFWAWLSPIVHLKEEQTTANVGLDAATFLRFLRLLRYVFSVISVIGAGLLVVNIIYNLKYVDSNKRNFMNLLTITNVRGAWVWPSVAASYLFNFVVMYFSWRNWTAMVMLRHRWFRSPAYQTKIYSRTLMITQIRKDYRSDAGLVALMGLLKVDGIKIGPEIDCATIGRRIGDFPELVDEHNEAVADLEKNLVKYLGSGKVAAKRPTIRKGAFLGILGGQKYDAIDYYAKQIKFLREKVDTQRQHIESLRKEQKRSRKGGMDHRIEGENYGFVTFKTISEAHRIARAHHGKLKELHGARLQLAPMPQDIVWQNLRREPGQVASRTQFGFFIIGIVCFLNTIPLLVVSLLANLSSLTVFVPFLESWSQAGQWGNWTFSLVSGVLPSVISFIFGYLLPIIIRRISKYQGAPTRSRLDRATTARYFAFIIISNLIIFSLLGVLYNTITQVVLEIGRHTSAKEVFESFKEIPYQIQNTYVIQSTYWLTWLPLRGFLVIFELIQLIKLALVSIRRFMFSHTPRDIREMTKPGYFDYPVVIVNLLYVCAIGMIYAPLAPLVAMGACIVFWFSSAVYKYQLLYVWISRAESGGRMWNVYVNRLLACCVLMQLLMILTTGLVRRRWLDTIAAAPPVLLIFAFKFWIKRVYGNKFRYYEPTPQEAEAERRSSMNEKRTRASDVEKRFLHPALQHDKLFKIMVHKKTEDAAREVLSAYPWFGDKYDSGFIKIKGVREDNLEYDPARDGPRDEAHQNDWDARSRTSTDMLGTSTRPTTPGTDDMFRSYPETPFTYKSPENSMRMGNNPSTDYLLARGEGSDIANAGFGFGGYPAPGYNRGGGDGEAYGRQQRFNQGLGMGLRSQSQESVTGVPLLQHAPQPDGEPRRARSRQGSTSTVGAPYPPTAYTQPVPHGYTPPGAPRQRSGSDLSYNGGGGSAGAPHQPQPWESNSDLSRSRQPSIGYGLPPGATMTGYNDSFAPSHVPRQGSASSQGQGQNRQSPPVQMDRYGSPGPILRHESPVSYSTPPPGSQDPRSQHPQGMRQPSASGPGGGMRPGGPRGPSGGGPPNQGRYEDPYGRYQ